MVGLHRSIYLHVSLLCVCLLHFFCLEPRLSLLRWTPPFVSTLQPKWLRGYMLFVRPKEEGIHKKRGDVEEKKKKSQKIVWKYRRHRNIAFDITVITQQGNYISDHPSMILRRTYICLYLRKRVPPPNTLHPRFVPDAWSSRQVSAAACHVRGERYEIPWLEWLSVDWPDSDNLNTLKIIYTLSISLRENYRF